VSNPAVLAAVFDWLSLDYTYPLLRNKDGINERLSGDVAQIAIHQNALQRLEAEEVFILSKLKLFCYFPRVRNFIQICASHHFLKI
jgi:hypothetical protein